MICAEMRRRDRRNARFWFVALIAGILASTALALSDIQPLIEGLLALIGSVGIFGFLAFLSTRDSLRGVLNDVIDWP